jgi:hypothetical protein
MSLNAWSSRGATARHHDLRSSASSGLVTGIGGRAQANRAKRRTPILKIRFISRNLALSPSSLHQQSSLSEIIDHRRLGFPFQIGILHT